MPDHHRGGAHEPHEEVKPTHEPGPAGVKGEAEVVECKNGEQEISKNKEGRDHAVALNRELALLRRTSPG